MNQTIVRTQGLTKQYGHHRAVSRISMHVRKGAVYGLIGRNGAGKTTFLKMLAGLASPSSGEIEIFGLRGKRTCKCTVPDRVPDRGTGDLRKFKRL